MPSGTENLNERVDQLVSTNIIKPTVAQIDVEFSNSMIEMLFHRLKHRHLFTIPLTNFEALEKGVNFYLTESNGAIPHSALKGATPEQSITGRWDDNKINDLREKIVQAAQRKDRYKSISTMHSLPGIIVAPKTPNLQIFI